VLSQLLDVEGVAAGPGERPLDRDGLVVGLLLTGRFDQRRTRVGPIRTPGMGPSTR